MLLPKRHLLPVLLFAGVVAGPAQVTITEYPIPTSSSSGTSYPSWITTGPDGNVWFTELYGNKIGKITTAGAITEFPIPTPGCDPYGIASGPDGNLWFAETLGNKIGKITTAGVITEYPVPTPVSEPFGITTGPDGNLWFTESSFYASNIGRITTAGAITEYPIAPRDGLQAYDITSGPDGNLWFTETAANKIGRVTTAGVITEFPTPTPGEPRGIARGPDGNLWFTDGNSIGRITTAGVITEYPIPTPSSGPFAITSGPDGNLWFTEAGGNQIGTINLVHPCLSAPVQGQDWVQQSPPASPPAREDHAIAYDASHCQVVLFGGYNGSSLSDTWAWDGTNWTQKFPANTPPARLEHVMAYDAAHGQVLLFGGVGTSGLLSDTWIWDGANWIQKTPVNSPSARYGSALAYDAHGELILFGGLDSSATYLSDTWIWDGVNWTQKQPQNIPRGRAAHAMAYDSTHGQVVLFGGVDNTADNAASRLSDTWVWDGANWTQKQPQNQPSARRSHAMAYDSTHGQVVLFGGYVGSFLADTWTWDGTNWSNPQPPNSPSVRENHAMAYDAAHSQVVLFGGYTSGFLADTWVWMSGDIPVTIASSPAGGAFTVSGAGCQPGSYTAPQTLVWSPGASCAVSFASPQSGTVGIQYVFSNWADGGNTANPRTIATPASSTTYTANFKTQYQLTTAVSPGSTGSVSGAGYYDSGASAPIVATPATNYQFANWTGPVASASSASTTVTLTGPVTVIANFQLITTTMVAPASGRYSDSIALSATIGPPGTAFTGNLQFQIDGVSVGSPVAIIGAGSYSTAYVIDKAAGSYSITATFTPATSSAAGSTGSNTLTVSRAIPTVTWSTPAAITYGTALSSTQLNATASIAGSFAYTPGGGTLLFAGIGQALSVSFTPTDTAHYATVTTSTTIDVGPKSTTVSVTAPDKTYDGTNTASIINCIVNGKVGLDNVTCSAGSATFADANAGSGKTVTATGILLSGTAAANYSLSSTTATTTASINQAPSTVTVSCPVSVTYNGSTQTPCTATVTGAGGLNQSLTVTYTNNTNAGAAGASASFAGDPNHTGNSGSGTFTINKAAATVTLGSLSAIYDGAPKSATATTNPPGLTVTLTYNGSSTAPTAANSYTVVGTISDPNYNGSVTGTLVILVPVTVKANINGPLISVDGSAGFTGSQNFAWTAGSTHSLSTLMLQTNSGTQYVWLNWSDGQPASHSITTPTLPATYTANFKTQYMLTTAVSPAATAGTISPASGFVDAGTVVAVIATANPFYVFNGFTGALSGTTTPQSLTVNAPMTVAANFITVQAAIQNIIDTVNSLSLNNTNSLVTKLQNAIAQLNGGNDNAASGQLNAFVNEVNALLNSRRLSALQGQALISSANTILGQIAAGPPTPALTFALQSRSIAGTFSNLAMTLSNTGTGAANNVTITSITGISASGATFVYVPGFLNPPFVVPGAANLAPGSTTGFNLMFQSTSGSPAKPFSFVITATADTVASFTTTINVP